MRVSACDFPFVKFVEVLRPPQGLPVVIHLVLSWRRHKEKKMSLFGNWVSSFMVTHTSPTATSSPPP
jgi:hypothetical protein